MTKPWPKPQGRKTLEKRKRMLERKPDMQARAEILKRRGREGRDD